jgi:large repetitive protein
LTVLNGKIYFRAVASGTGFEPWVSDGTASGTKALGDANPGGGSSYPTGFMRAGKKVVFRADNPTHGEEPWITDGTASGTALLADLHGAPPSFDPSRLVSAGESLYFTKPNNIDLWATDGTTAGTRRVFASHIVHLAPRADGSELLFSEEYSLWRMTSAAATPRLVHRFSGPAGRFVSVPGRTYISSGLDFLRLDDGATKTTQLMSLKGYFNLVQPFQFTPSGNVVYFLASQGTFGSSGLFVTDGTAAGTKLLHSGKVGGRGIANVFVAMTKGSGAGGQGKLWYVYRNGTARELWLTDFLGARKVATIGATSAYPGTYPEPIATFGNGVVFAGRDKAGLEPWFSDGTTTARLADLNPGSGDSAPQNFTVAGKTLFFAADDGVRGCELWRSNGTSAGTVRVADIWPGPMGSTPAELVPAGSGDRVLFSANDGATGREAWVSDGTAVGTRRVADAVPGAGGAAPTNFVRVGTRFVLSAYAPSRGREPHVLPLVDTGGWLAEAYGTGCLGSSGVPLLSPKGSARVGASGFALELSRARARSGATLFGGLYGRVPFGKCELLLNPLLPLLRVITDAAGRGTYGLPIPNNTALIGIDIRFQALVSDPSGASGMGLSTTNGLHVMIGR